MASNLKGFVAGVSIGMAIVFGASAQQASGNIIGTASTGDTVVVQGADTGFHRELEIKKDGKYQVRSVPIGAYDVTVSHADGKSELTKVVVRAGSSARVK